MISTSNQNKTSVDAVFQSHLLVCYTRAQVKREQMEILQHQPTSLYIHFICHHRIIPYALMYNQTLPPRSYIPLTELFSNITTPYHLTYQHHRRQLYHNVICHQHCTSFSYLPWVFQHLCLSATLIPLEFLLSLITHNLGHKCMPLQ